MNTNQENMNDDMLVKYLLGEATHNEQHDVAAWIDANADNKKYFEHFKLIWDQSKQLAAKSTVDTNAAWQRFVTRTEQHTAQQATAPSRSIPLFQRTWLRAAAVLLLCTGLALTLYKMKDPAIQTMIVRSSDATITDTLPDGSVVVLNKNSYIAYKSRFDANERKVTLHGEAFFTVTPDKKKPFIIDANNTTVTVVGTSFNVKTSVDRTEVIVETGIVQVAKKEKVIKLLPHQKATVTGNDKPYMQSNTDELYNYYRTHKFVCRATPLSTLVPVLNEAYDARISVAGSAASRMLNADINSDQSLDQVLELIKTSLPGIDIERSGSQITIK